MWFGLFFPPFALLIAVVADVFAFGRGFDLLRLGRVAVLASGCMAVSLVIYVARVLRSISITLDESEQFTFEEGARIAAADMVRTRGIRPTSRDDHR
ncbi:MAG: hypothetical protein HOV79_10880 [Hamadaea sp.]|nr:hypothetical protein [Hamadaea sp.]